MKIYSEKGSKERLFEMMQKVNKVTINEAKAAKIETKKVINERRNYLAESTDTDRYEDVVFMQGEEADEALEILDNKGEDEALRYLKQWHYPGEHMGSDSLGHGGSDRTYEDDGYIMSWNTSLNYIGLQFDTTYQADNNLNEEAMDHPETNVNDYDNEQNDDLTPDEDDLEYNNAVSAIDAMGIEPQSTEIEPQSTEDILHGGLGDDAAGMTVNMEQVRKGIAVELEHTNNPLIALEIVADHLAEDENYYGTGDEDPETAAMCGAQDDVEDEEVDKDKDMENLLLGQKFPNNQQ